MATIGVVVTGTPMETVTVKDGDLVIIRFNDDVGPEMLQRMCEQAVDVIRGLGVKVSCMAIGASFPQTTVEVFDRLEMRSLGWVRADPLDGG